MSFNFTMAHAEDILNGNKDVGKWYKAMTNLKKNPEKEYILWPNRLNKVEEFETMITRIYNGD